MPLASGVDGAILFGDRRRPPATIAAEIDRIIGLNIRRAREDVRLGQHEVATLLGLSVHLLARYEEGQERAPASVLLEIGRHLGCQLTDLFAGMPSMEPDDDFPGSRASAIPSATANAEQRPSATGGPLPAPASAGSDPPDVAVASRNDALAVAGIIKSFSDLNSPVLRERLLGLLHALA